MRWLRSFWVRLGGVFSPARRERAGREFDEEIQSHLAMHVEDNMRAGMTAAQARREAVMKLGGVEVARQARREGVIVVLMENLWQDIRYALRQLGKTPGFTLTVVLTLALGIGANAAIFTLVNAVLLKNLPVADPKSLVRFGERFDCCVFSGIMPEGDYSLFSTDTYEQLRKNNLEFEELAAMQAGFEPRPVIARRDGGREVARAIAGEFVSGNYFRMFGLQPTVGRLLNDADNAIGAPMVAVMSYETWNTKYNSDPAVVGSTFWINAKAVTIVGIAPQGFFGDRQSSGPPNFYLPIQSMVVIEGADYVRDPDQLWLSIMGRVKPGTNLQALQQKVSTQLQQLMAQGKIFSSANDRPLLAKVHVVLAPGGAGIQSMAERYQSKLELLMWISGLVLLIACANIANLLLVRGMGRKAEISLRTALGARRGRVVRQLLTESIVLAGMGGIAGLAVAYAGTRMLLLMAFPWAKNIPIDASPSPEVVGFAFGLSLLTGILFGMAPAWITAKAEPADALRTGSRTTSSGASLLQRGLVVVQAALSLVLLVCAGLFSQSLSKLQNTDMKLDATNRYIVHMDTQTRFTSITQAEAIYRTIEERFHAIPGVVKVGIATYTPMEDNNNGWGVQVEGRPGVYKQASFIKANAEYFDSVGTHVLMGRGITAQDTSTAPPVAVVNESFARTFFKPGESPIGHRFGADGFDGTTSAYEIVGVAAETSYTDVRKNYRHPMYFVPLGQRAAETKMSFEKDFMMYAGTVVLETSQPMDDMETLARKTLSGINPNYTVVKFQSFSDQIADRFTQERMLARLTMLFGGLALLLAAIGLYGVTSYTVVRRTPEIGIRMALGAKRGSVIAMVMRGAVMQALVGLAIGVPVALLCVRFVKTQLYDITKVDAGLLAGAIATLAVAACIAGMIPAQRAASVDPALTLRSE
jgi:macrolide transport system ATP-binding/permease protein